MPVWGQTLADVAEDCGIMGGILAAWRAWVVLRESVRCGGSLSVGDDDDIDGSFLRS